VWITTLFTSRGFGYIVKIWIKKKGGANMNKKQFRDWGKQGSDRRWNHRYELIKEIAGHTTKEELDWIIDWPTDSIEFFLGYIKNHKIKRLNATDKII
jgi:hypothetical protein